MFLTFLFKILILFIFKLNFVQVTPKFFRLPPKAQIFLNLQYSNMLFNFKTSKFLSSVIPLPTLIASRYQIYHLIIYPSQQKVTNTTEQTFQLIRQCKFWDWSYYNRIYLFILLICFLIILDSTIKDVQFVKQQETSTSHKNCEAN